MYHLPFISYYVIDTFGKVFWTFLSILFMYFRGENTSLNLDFIPIGYVHCSYIVLCIASLGLVCFATLHTVSVFAIVWRGSFVYDLLSLCIRVSNASFLFLFYV